MAMGSPPGQRRRLARWARQFHVSSSSPFSLLATQIGEDCAGAVRFAPPDEIDRVLARPGGVTWLTEDEVDSAYGTSVKTRRPGSAGPSPASSASPEPRRRLHCSSRMGVGVFRPAPPRPPTSSSRRSPALDDHDLNEHLCLDAARRAGLVAVRTKVSRFGDESLSSSTATTGGRSGVEIIRVHQEDLCQALGLPPSRKYQNEGGPGPRRHRQTLSSGQCRSWAADDAVWRFADALIWNWLIAGTDAHAKNYSLLLAEDQVRLAPLYDVASALPTTCTSGS